MQKKCGPHLVKDQMGESTYVRCRLMRLIDGGIINIACVASQVKYLMKVFLRII